MDKQTGVFEFKYTELIDKHEITNKLVIETKDVVHSILRFGESRKLIDLHIKQLNNTNN